MSFSRLIAVGRLECHQANVQSATLPDKLYNAIGLKDSDIARRVMMTEKKNG